MKQEKNSIFIMPTENVRKFTELEKAVIEKADSLSITVIENTIDINYDGKISCTNNNFFIEELDDEILNIKFSNSDLSLTVEYHEGKPFYFVEGLIEITKINSELKKIVKDFFKNKKDA